jgi:phage portal protein BeeE
MTPWAGGLSAYATQPWNHVVIPDPGTITAFPTQVWDVQSALRIPSVSRATSLYSGLIRQCPLDAWKGMTPLDRPRLLDRPDPFRSRAWFVGVQVEDYLWHGNALAVVTTRNAEGWPASVAWVPAATANMWVDDDGSPHYLSNGRELNARNVIHVRRSADRFRPWRGVGVVEQHLGTLDRVAMEEEYERSSLAGAGVPSVAIIANNPGLSQEEADDGKISWMDKYAGPQRTPAILPYGTQVVPLGWSPSDSQMVEARKMSLIDVANAFNLDGYWLGAEMRGLTYRSPGPLYLGLLRTSLEPVMADFEQAWADDWLPRGQSIRFDRLQLTRDDFGATIDALAKAVAPPQSDPTVGGILSVPEARAYMALPAAQAAGVVSPVDTVVEEPAP